MLCGRSVGHFLVSSPRKLSSSPSFLCAFDEFHDQLLVQPVRFVDERQRIGIGAATRLARSPDAPQRSPISIEHADAPGDSRRRPRSLRQRRYGGDRLVPHFVALVNLRQAFVGDACRSGVRRRSDDPRPAPRHSRACLRISGFRRRAIDEQLAPFFQQARLQFEVAGADAFGGDFA